MLRITRKLYESFVIQVPPSDKPQKVKVIVSNLQRIDDDRVGLAIDAHRDITILRSELIDNAAP
ncbi:carbon storage regulator [Anatilimnocola floriformis]|uniref:carbon storage regulator n=1 Tax=Anatilimnocola floriformis TaxID=2948575 RepID=UPI0036F41260